MHPKRSFEVSALGLENAAETNIAPLRPMYSYSTVRVLFVLFYVHTNIFLFVSKRLVKNEVKMVNFGVLGKGWMNDEPRV